MSLDVYLEGEAASVPCTCHCGHDHQRAETLEHFSANITHNLNAMAGAAGIYKPMWRPEEIGITKAYDLIPHLRDGLHELKANPERFKAFNPSNGWGSYDGLVDFVTKYLNACQENPDANVRASR